MNTPAPPALPAQRRLRPIPAPRPNVITTLWSPSAAACCPQGNWVSTTGYRYPSWCPPRSGSWKPGPAPDLTTSGIHLPIGDVIRMGAHAHHYLVVYENHREVPLYLGRAKRVATPGQRIVLHNRDRGCTRPGCTCSTDRSQVHHARKDFSRGGLTDITDLALACPKSNRLVHDKGWRTRIRDDGRVEWIPPPLLDTGQDRINHYWHPEDLFHPPVDGKEMTSRCRSMVDTDTHTTRHRPAYARPAGGSRCRRRARQCPCGGSDWRGILGEHQGRGAGIGDGLGIIDELWSGPIIPLPPSSGRNSWAGRRTGHGSPSCDSRGPHRSSAR